MAKSYTFPQRCILVLLFFAYLPLAAFSNHTLSTFYEFEVTVLDERGVPMYGVNVFTDDQAKVATSTDDKGKAILKDLNNRDVVNFSFIGYNQLSLPFFEIRKRNGIIKMVKAIEELGEVVVIGRRDDLPKQVPYTFEKITKEEIAHTESQTSADALWKEAGVFVQKSQMGGGSPVLRGFEANRVLLVVDGVRMNTAIYRSGHLQNSITVDNAMLERTEVIYGPGSLMYGSDALGGVIHFRSKEPLLSFDDTPGSYKIGANLYARYASANSEKSIHADINYGKNKWASLTSLTFTDYGDLHTGKNHPAGYEDFGLRKYFVRRVNGNDQVIENVLADDVGNLTPNYHVQVGTGYSQMDFTQKIKYQPNRNFYTIFNFQNSTSSDVPRYDRLTETTNAADPTSLRYAEWYYGPQRRLFGSIKSRLSKKTSIYDRATFIASMQRIHENRLERRLHKSQRTFQLENVYMGTFTADFDKKLNESGQHNLMYGVDATYNNVQSEAGKVRLKDETLNQNALPRYPSANNVVQTGAYTNYQWNNRDTTVTLNGGLRYNYAYLHSKYSADSIISWPANFIDPGTSSTNTDLTWSLGGAYQSHGGFGFRALGSKAFRSPNIDDYSQLRPQNGFVSIPNPDLKPERTYNAELSLSQQVGSASGLRARLALTAYYTYAKGLMTRRAFPLPDGSNLLESEGDIYETRANINANKAIIKGISGDLQIKFGEHWELKSNLSYTKGDASFDVKDAQGLVVFDTLAPLDHIPPTHGMTSLTFMTQKLRLSAVARYMGAKTIDRYGVSGVSLDAQGNPVLSRSGTEDNSEYSYYHFEDGKQVFDGTLAWTTWDFYASWNVTKWYTLQFSVENIADLHYRPFASGVSAAGRNFIVSFRINLAN